MRNISLTFAAGCFGGLLYSLALWGAGDAGITATLGVSIKPALTPSWLYPRIVWGGLWGFLFILPLFKNRTLMRGFFFSLGPSAAQLFWVFPYEMHEGMFGLELGTLTPAVVVVVNTVWGVATSIWLRASR